MGRFGVLILLVLVVGCDAATPSAKTAGKGVRGGWPTNSTSAPAVAARTATPMIPQIWTIDDFPGKQIVQFDSVFWEPDDSISMRAWLRDTDLVRGKRVFEIGVGTGLLSLCALQAGATAVLGTDINPAAVQCALYNAANLDLVDRFEVRLVDPGHPAAFAVLKPGENFDVIISNPPWEDGTITQPADHAFFDPGFALLDSLLEGLDDRLAPGGQCLLAYGAVPAIRRILQRAPQFGFRVEILDDRNLDELSENFLPGMLLRLTRQAD